tara:strand:- start:85 stop:1098 length:1014 start_codon:yes stop_codon:yes gene_type:complete
LITVEVIINNQIIRILSQNSFYSDLISFSQAKEHFRKCSNRTLFHNPDFINEIIGEVNWIGGFKKNSLLCTMPIFKSELPDFFYYSGPLWDSNWLKLKPYRRFSTSQKIYEKMINNILNIQEKIMIQFPDTKSDIRAFDWWNYGKREEIRFKTEIKYTAKIFNLQKQSINDLKSNLRSDDKKKRLKRIIKESSNIEITYQISKTEFIDLYLQTMNRVEATITNKSLAILSKLFDYVNQDERGFKLTFRDSRNNKLIGSQLVIYQDKNANAIAQGINKESYTSEIVTYLIFNSILKSKEEGKEVFDFNGANSPKRADDKHAYGAEEVPFICLTYGDFN